MNTKNHSVKIIHYLFCVALAVVCFTANAQRPKNSEKRTILNKQPAVRVVTRAGINTTKVDKSIAIMAQPSVGLLFNDKFLIAVSTNLCLNERYLNDASYQPIKDETSNWEIGYIGLSLEYIFTPLKAISPGIGINTGWGKGERNFNWNSLNKQSPEWGLVNKNLCRKGYFFFAEPVASINFNLSQMVLLKANLGYRFVSFDNTIPAMEMPNKKFNGLSGGVTVMFSNIFKTGK